FDAVGISRTIGDALQATAFGGRVCLVGMGSPRVELDAFRVSTEERTIVGSFTYSARDFQDAAAYIGSGDPAVGELISREVRPEEADTAFRGLADGDGTAGKVLVRFDV
ncbi:MAG: zinc-binding dehydrogenase, partial [Microbacterium sp.]